MRRRLLNFLTALSLMLLVVALPMWHRSHSGVDSVVFGGESHREGSARRAITTAVCSSQGRVWFLRFRDTVEGEMAEHALEVQESPDVEVWLAEDFAATSPGSCRLRSRDLSALIGETAFGRWGFGMQRASGSSTIRYGEGFPFSAYRRTQQGRRRTERLTLAAPYWALALAASILPTLRLSARLYRSLWRRAHAGLCPTCGYDLTGNVSGVCPECGTETP